MRIGKAVETYLSGLQLLGGDEHQEQAQIILERFAEWLETPHKECKRPVGDLSELSNQDLTEFLAWRKKQPGLRKGTTISPFTLSKEARYLRTFLNYAFADRRTFELTLEAVQPTVPKIREPKVIPRSLEGPDLTDLFSACVHAKYPIIPGITPQEWWFSLQYLAYVTSMRRKALFGLPRPTDDELNRGIISLPYTEDKASSDRRFPLTPLACDLIKRLPAKPGERMFVWTSKQGRHDYRSFYHEAERMQRKAGIMGSDQSRLHVLRKTSLTHMAENGVQMATVQQHAGHSSMEVTAKYYLGVLSAPRVDAVKGLIVPSAPGKEVQRKLFD